MCWRRSSSRRSRRSTPPSVTRPCCGSQKRSSRLATVDLPAPDAPTSATVLPGGTSKLTRSIAGTLRPGYVKDVASKRTAGSAGIACVPPVTGTGLLQRAQAARRRDRIGELARAQPISATGMNAATATSTSSGNDSRGNQPRAHSSAPSAATTSPPARSRFPARHFAPTDRRAALRVACGTRRLRPRTLRAGAQWPGTR